MLSTVLVFREHDPVTLTQMYARDPLTLTLMYARDLLTLTQMYACDPLTLTQMYARDPLTLTLMPCGCCPIHHLHFLGDSCDFPRSYTS